MMPPRQGWIARKFNRRFAAVSWRLSFWRGVGEQFTARCLLGSSSSDRKCIGSLDTVELPDALEKEPARVEMAAHPQPGESVTARVVLARCR
jgi:hypothetical protein